MAVTNRDRVGKGLVLMAAGIRPFLERELNAQPWAGWEAVAPEQFRDPS
jgi:hypothetical protein